MSTTTPEEPPGPQPIPHHVAVPRHEAQLPGLAEAESEPAANQGALPVGAWETDGPQTAMLDYDERRGTLVRSRLVGLEARNVSAWFGSHKVLERVSLAMEPGLVTALIGPSGCG